jgi:hypothetical protein
LAKDFNKNKIDKRIILSNRTGDDIVKFVSCNEKEATHVKIIDDDIYGEALTFGGIYEYLYDADPSEETHYLIMDDGKLFYDFECVIKVEYLKKANE